MTTLLLPLGLIVNTNDMKSIIAFQALADKLSLGIKITSILADLQALFIDFNLGKLSEIQFEAALLDAIEKKIPEANKSQLSDDWKTTWKKEWKAAWNAMCQFDERAIKIVQTIVSKGDVTFYIYSDTNPVQFEFIAKKLLEYGINPAQVHTTFSNGNSIDTLITNLIAKCKDDINSKQCSIILGNPNHIRAESLRSLALKKQEIILTLAAKSNLSVLALEESHLTLERLQQFLDQMKPSMAAAASSALSSSSSSSAQSDLRGAGAPTQTETTPRSLLYQQQLNQAKLKEQENELAAATDPQLTSSVNAANICKQ